MVTGVKGDTSVQSCQLAQICLENHIRTWILAFSVHFSAGASRAHRMHTCQHCQQVRATREWLFLHVLTEGCLRGLGFSRVSEFIYDFKRKENNARTKRGEQGWGECEGTGEEGGRVCSGPREATNEEGGRVCSKPKEGTGEEAPCLQGQFINKCLRCEAYWMFGCYWTKLYETTSQPLFSLGSPFPCQCPAWTASTTGRKRWLQRLNYAHPYLQLVPCPPELLIVVTATVLLSVLGHFPIVFPNQRGRMIFGLYRADGLCPEICHRLKWYTKSLNTFCTVLQCPDFAFSCSKLSVRGQQQQGSGEGEGDKTIICQSWSPFQADGENNENDEEVTTCDSQGERRMATNVFHRLTEKGQKKQKQYFPKAKVKQKIFKAKKGCQLVHFINFFVLLQNWTKLENCTHKKSND